MLRIRELRENKGIKQKDMAETLKIGLSTLSQYETGKREPDYLMLVKLADYFEVSVDFLLGKSNEKKEDIRVADSNNLSIETEIIEKYKNLSGKNQKKAEEYLDMLLKLEEAEAIASEKKRHKKA